MRRTFLLALLAASFVPAAPAVAAPLPGSAYDTGDGNQDNGLGLDWQGAVSAGAVKESPDANDDCFVGGVKELTPNQWAFNRSAGGCTPGKSNLRVAYVNPESAAATTFGHFAFFRNDTTGNSFLTFELNQVKGTWTNATGTTIPCRSTGDLLLSFEVGGSTLTTSLYRWLGDGSGPAACPNGASGTFSGSGVIPAGRFQGAMNASSLIANYVNPAAYGASFPANAFGEAAIDLPAVLQSMGASPCFGFLQMQVHSRSSSSISSAMIDYTSPVPVNVQSCAATGTQYQDTNGNGTRDSGEPGVAGFEAYVDLDDDGFHDAGEPSGVSDATGFYRILDVPAGSARVRQVPRAGWACSQPSPCSYARTFVTSGNSTGNDFGNLGPSTASGLAYDDRDGDGVRDAGESPLQGATLFADLDDDGAHDAAEPSAVSAADGTWTIGDIPAGTLRIREATPAGRTCSQPSPCSSQHTFSSGSAVTGLVFGSWAGATIGGTVTETGAGPLAGVQVFLDTDSDGAFQLGEPQTTTSAAGAYSFTGLAPGAYDVRPTVASSWYCASACEQYVFPTSGVTAGGRDFVLGRYGTVSGTVWDDVDGDGVRESGDNAVAGFTQWADYDGDNALDAGEPSAVSSATGTYTLTGVRAGTWTVRQAPNGAYACTSPSPCTYAVTLASNGAVTGRDFGDYVSRSVSGTVYRDGDADGLVPEAGDPGLAGWLVYADADNDSVHDAIEPSATTNSAGRYNLTGLANGSYRVRLVGQAGWTCSAPASCTNTGSIGSGQSDTGMDFGVWGPATISGRVFEDTNADGSAGTPRSGRTVYVDSDNDGVHDGGEPSATSAADGTYSISGLNPGTYVVRQVLPAGWICSRPTPCSYTVTTATSVLTDRDFASYTTGTVAGSVLEDADADADGDTALAGRTVYADTDGDGTHDAGEPSTTSGATGAYTLGGLMPGSRTIRQVVPAGWTQSAPSTPHTITVSSGSAATGRDFASHTTGSIAGTAFEDADFDGAAREGGDPGIAGRTLYLDLDGDRAPGAGEPEATTGGAGAYAFTGLEPGEYTVRAVMPAGWACAYPADCAATATVTSGASVTGRDFGSYVGASVSGTVFEDLDADGAARETGEPGAAGRRVFLDGNADGTRQPSEPTTLTDAGGAYTFSGITAQAWRVRLELPASWSCDRPAPCLYDVTLTSGSDHPGRDLGVHAAGSIAGHLFTDRDADGQPQAFGENDQPERTVFLDADDDGTLDAGEPSVLTDDRGDYAFTGVQPGVHRVRQVLPADWTCSTPDPCLQDVALTSGEAETGRDFSSWTTASLTGLYFEDADGDGEYPEPGEDGLGGRTVYVDADADGTHDAGEPATVTSGGGGFSFSGLEPGAYVVRSADQPADWTCSYPDPCAATLTLEAAERAQDVDFGAFTTGTVTGTVSRQDTTAGLGGWTVYADADGSGTLDAGEPSATTLGDGTYALDLEPGDHTVRQVAPTGWTCAAPDPCERAVTVASQETIAAQDFVNVAAAALTGTVFEDLDGDGVKDAGEPGVAAVAVTHESGDPSATTAAGGGYELSVDAGTHTFSIAPPAGFTCGTPSTCSRTASVDAGETASDLDFAVWRVASVSGTVREDTDADGDGDAPLAGRTVYADLDDDGSADPAEPTATSGADGAYTVSGLAPGPHTIRLAAATGSTCSAPDPCERDVVLASDEDATGADFAVWREGAIEGVVVDDTDGDGAVDTGEAGLEGIVVFLDADGDGTRGTGEPTATTDVTGAYSLPGLRPGEHRVRLELPTGRRCTGTPTCAADRVVAGGETVTHDVAVWAPSTLSGTVFADADADGAARETGEPGLAAEIYVDADGDGERDAGEPAATADADGAYTIAGLAPGSHTVRVLVPAGWRCTRPDPCTRTITATSGSTPVVPDFGLAEETANLGVALDRTPTTLVAGEAVTWTATVVNDGPYAADDATLTVELPPGLTDVTWDGSCTRAGQTLTCTLGDLAVGATVALAIAATIAPDQAGGTLPISAAVAALQPDRDPSDDDADDEPAVEGRADLRTTATLPAGADVGTTVDLVLAVANHGPSDTTAAVLEATLPEGLDPVLADLPAGCTVAARVVTCALGDLAVGGSASRTIPVSVLPSAGGQDLTVPVAATSDLPDPTPPDASAEAELTAVPVADVEVVVADPPHEAPGGYAYGLTVLNRGPSTATGVVLTDGPFPGGRIVSATTSQGTCTVEPGGSLRCELGDLPDGAEVRITVVIEVDEGSDPAAIAIAPSVDGAESDPALANNATALRLPPREAAPAPEPQPDPEPQPEPAPEPPVVSPAAAPPPAPCASKRIFDVKLRKLRNHRIRKVWMSLNGKPLKVTKRRGRFVATVDLRGRPTGVSVLRIRARTSTGRILRGVRRYQTCTEIPRMGLPPL